MGNIRGENDNVDGHTKTVRPVRFNYDLTLHVIQLDEDVVIEGELPPLPTDVHLICLRN